MVVLGYLLSPGLDVCNCKAFQIWSFMKWHMSFKLTLVFFLKWDLKKMKKNLSFAPKLPFKWLGFRANPGEKEHCCLLHFFCRFSQWQRCDWTGLFSKRCFVTEQVACITVAQQHMTETEWLSKPEHKLQDTVLLWTVRNVTKVDFIPNKGQTATYSYLQYLPKGIQLFLN